MKQNRDFFRYEMPDAKAADLASDSIISFPARRFLHLRIEEWLFFCYTVSWFIVCISTHTADVIEAV